MYLEKTIEEIDKVIKILEAEKKQQEQFIKDLDELAVDMEDMRKRLDKYHIVCEE